MSDIMDGTFDLAALPEAHFVPNQGAPGGRQETRPCYVLLGDCYFGDQYFLEGETVITGMVPNEAMQPLNKAAGKAFVAFKERQAVHGGTTITVEDYSQAAYMLREDPSVKNLSHDDFAAAVTRLAASLKAKRESTQFFIPDIATRRASSKVPPMPNMALSDPTHRGPDRRIISEPKPSASPVQRAAPARRQEPA